MNTIRPTLVQFSDSPSNRHRFNDVLYGVPDALVSLDWKLGAIDGHTFLPSAAKDGGRFDCTFYWCDENGSETDHDTATHVAVYVGSTEATLQERLAEQDALAKALERRRDLGQRQFRMQEQRLQRPREAALCALRERACEQGADCSAIIAEVLATYRDEMSTRQRFAFEGLLDGYAFFPDYNEDADLREKWRLNYRLRPGRIVTLKPDGTHEQVAHHLTRHTEYFIPTALNKLIELCAAQPGEDVLIEMPEMKSWMGESFATPYLVCQKKEVEQIISVDRRSVASILDVMINPQIPWYTAMERKSNTSRSEREAERPAPQLLDSRKPKPAVAEPQPLNIADYFGHCSPGPLRWSSSGWKPCTQAKQYNRKQRTREMAARALRVTGWDIEAGSTTSLLPEGRKGELECMFYWADDKGEMTMYENSTQMMVVVTWPDDETRQAECRAEQQRILDVMAVAENFESDEFKAIEASMRSECDSKLALLYERIQDRQSDYGAVASELLSQHTALLWDAAKQLLHCESTGFGAMAELYYLRQPIKRHHEGYMRHFAMFYRSVPGKVFLKAPDGVLHPLEPYSNRKKFFVGAPISQLQLLEREGVDEVEIELPELTKLTGPKDGAKVVLRCEPEVFAGILRDAREAIASVIDLTLHREKWAIDEIREVRRKHREDARKDKKACVTS